MGNPDHLKELLKGVDHWNAWRAEQGRRFLPDFSHTDIREAFRSNGLLDTNLRIPLNRVNLFEANLESASLGYADLKFAALLGANLHGADLWEADLSGAKLRAADLSEADLGGADLSHADLRRTDFSETNVETLAHRSMRRHANLRPKDQVYQANISKAKNLTQGQLNKMRGDSETIIPDNLERPAHWPVVEVTSDPESEPDQPVLGDTSEALLRPFTPITPAVEVRWEGDALHAELRAQEPRRRAFHPPIAPDANMDLLSSLGQISGQLETMLKANATENTQRITGDAAPLFKAIQSEIEKPEGRVLSFTIDFNLKLVKALSKDEDFSALTIVDKEAIRQFLDLGDKWRRTNGLIEEIENSLHPEIVPEDRIDEIEARVEDFIELVTAPENEEYFSPELPAVTRAMSLHPWDADDLDRNRKARLAAFGALAAQFIRALANPPKAVREGGGFWATLAGAAAAIATLFLPS